jgi:hypothetical protein
LKEKNDVKRAYRVLNLVLALVLSGVFVYAALFPPEGGHPIPSGSQVFFNTTSPTTGLSRSFSALIRFDYATAVTYNPLGPRIFNFFLFQLCIRIFLLLLLPRYSHSLRILYIPDIILSTLLFFVVFWPLIYTLYTRI